MLATRKAEVSGHAPQPRGRGPSGFQPEAARLSALTSRKWSLRLDSHQHLTAYETAALPFMLRSGKTRSASRTCTGLSPLPTGCVALYALAECGNGRAPRCCPEYLADPNGADYCLPRARQKRGATGNRTLICAMPLRRPAIERWPRKWVGPAGNAPAISPIPQTWRGLLSSSCPQTWCRIEMDTHPGLAPGNSVLQTDGSTPLPCARS